MSKSSLSHHCSVSPDTAASLARSYHVLQNKPVLMKLLEDAIGIDVKDWSKVAMHKAINDIILSKYEGEARIKSMLVDHFKAENVVAAFEIKTPSSRLDFLRVNGHTISYEIKSEVDSLQKLDKQIKDYSRLFDYNYVVIDRKHLEKVMEIIPKHYGIYVSGRNKMVREKPASNCNELNGELQLLLFTKKELRKFFDGCTDREEIIQHQTASGINDTFKEMLKARYRKRWHFLREPQENIFPVDYQYFFYHNLEPEVVY